MAPGRSARRLPESRTTVSKTVNNSTTARHAPHRGRLIISEQAAAPIAALTDRELHALDRALVAISIDPHIGDALADSRLHDYRDGTIRVIYHVTTRGTIIIAYTET